MSALCVGRFADEAGASEDDVGASVRSIALNTDLSMMDIDLLQSGIRDLSTEVERLHQKLVLTSTRGAELKPKHEDLFSVSWSSLHCKLEPNPVLIDEWQNADRSPSPTLLLKACKIEPHSYHDDKYQLLERFSGTWSSLHCKTELNPDPMSPEEMLGKDQKSLLALKQEFCLVPECKPEPHLIVYKLEPEAPALLCTRQAQSEERPVRTPIKACSVKLVDCRKALEIQDGEQKDDLSASGEIKNNRRSKVLEPGTPSGAPTSDERAERPYPCSTCKRSFTKKCNLSRHLRIHSREKHFGCAHCERRFTRLVYLNAHKKIHVTKQPCKCLQCGKQFPIASKLRLHQRVHGKGKPHVCPSRGRGSSDSSALKRRRRKQAGDQTFACQTCQELIHSGKRFSRSSAHLRAHAGPKTYPCSKCEKSFTQSAHVRKLSRSCDPKPRSSKLRFRSPKPHDRCGTSEGPRKGLPHPRAKFF